jgi:general secretion pathway protein B
VSILLEALRKSEKNQNPPEAPDIHTDDDSNRHVENIQTGPLAILLVLALFISGWFVWNQYQPPEGLYQAPVTLTASKKSSAVTEAASKKATAAQDTQIQPTAAVTDKPEERPRTPVESYQEAIKNIAKDQPAASKQAAPVKATPVAKPPAKPSKNQPKVAKNTELFNPREPAPITYWELPDSIREDVPEIKFSVLVYAKNPDDRFVLINGQRLGEGDDVLPGLLVKEIRRDGVVFSYRLYQFLVER